MDGRIYDHPPLLMVFYGLTDKSGAFTLANVLAIFTPEHLKALWLSLVLAGVSTVICLLSLAYPLALILRNAISEKAAS